MKTLTQDTRGAVYVELLIAIIPVLTLAMGIFQLTELYTAKVLVDHAAVSAARSAITVFADDPKFYGGEPANEERPRRAAAVRTAALRAMAPFIMDGSLRTADVTFPDGVPKTRGAPLTVEVRSTYLCRVMLVQRIVCSGSGTRALVGRATLPAMAADFTY